jgi:hypothetical protein
MKKALSIMIVLAIALSMFGMIANAEVLEKDDLTDEGESVVVLWDSSQINGEVLGKDGFPLEYLLDHDFTIAGPAENFGVAGWVGCSQDIVAFGYSVDDGEPVMSADYKYETRQDVIDAAKSFGCDYASRFRIMVDGNGLEGTHKYSFLCQIEDGKIFKMSITDGTEVGFSYSADGTLPSPTPTIDPESEQIPMIMLRFDEEDKYIEGGLFSFSLNAIESIEFDAEKKCYVIHMENAADPWVVMLFSTLAMEDDTYIIEADKYKYMQLGIRTSNADAGSLGQIYFQTDENTGFDEPKAVVFQLKPTDERQFINVNLGRNKKWKGMMLDTRLDPFGECNGECDFEVYYIAFFSNEGEAKTFGESWLAQGDEVMPTKAPTPEPTEVPTQAPTAEASPVITSVPTEETVPTAQPTDAPINGNTGNKGVNPGVIIGIIAGVAVIAIVVAIILISKKKKK